MPIKSGDIKLLASKIMDDVPNGGGGPSGVLIADGASNAIYTDITELDRSNGNVSIRQLTVSVQTPDTDSYMGCTIVVSKPPNDPNVSITLAKCAPFARRTDIANTLENYLIQASEWAGYLFENHVAGQRSIQLLQRPGTPLPPIGRTLALIASEGLPAQVTQYVRMTKVESVTRTFTDSTGSSFVDYTANLVTCEISDALRSNFPGSPPSRTFSRNLTKTIVRDTTVADAATFFGATTLTAVGAVGDSVLKIATVYSQLVPSSRTESIALDQKPASQRTLTLATAPRNVQVGITPHTMRIRVGQENRGFAWTQMLKPRPAPGTVVISYMALGNWYTITDDGLGALEGGGVGTVNYLTGSIAVTMPSMPDAGTSIMFSWGENTAYTSHAGQAGYRAPEFAWEVPQAPLKPGSVVVKWTSGGAAKTATDNGAGAFAGDATGEINYASGKIFIRPTAMIDAGGEFVTDYIYTSQSTKQVAGLVPDAGGFVNIVLDEAPAPKSVTVRWVTVRNVSASSGSTELVSKSGSASVDDSPKAEVLVGAASGYFINTNTDYYLSGATINLKAKAGKLNTPQTAGTYKWRLTDGRALDGSPASVNAITSNGEIEGDIMLAIPDFIPPVPTINPNPDNQDFWDKSLVGSASISVSATAPDITFAIELRNQADTVIALSRRITVDAVGAVAPVIIPPVKPPEPCVFTREPIRVDDGPMGVSAVGGMKLAGVDDAGKRVYVTCGPIYNDVYGYHYDGPASTANVFSAADIAAGKKTLTSAAGISTEYTIFGA